MLITIKNPYTITERDNQYCVVLETTGESVGCSTTLAEAQAHLAALEANVPDAKADWSEADHPRDDSGQFGSGGGGGSDSDSEADTEEDNEPAETPKPEKPKRGKPDWAKRENRVASRDEAGYVDYGDIARNPKNAASNEQIRAMSETHVSNLNTKQQDAITTYTGESYQEINSGLRGGGKLSASNQRAVDNLDAALSSNSLSEPTILYRGMRLSPEMSSRLTTGTTFSDQAYTSASFDHAMADQYVRGDESAMLRIRAPAGTRGMSVSSISNFPPEQEFLLPRNTSYRITSVSRDSRGQYYVDAEIVEGGS